MSLPILFLIAGSAAFAAFLCAAPSLLIRAIYGAVTDPEHIAALRYSHEPFCEHERSHAPDVGADIHGGGRDAFTHNRASAQHRS